MHIFLRSLAGSLLLAALLMVIHHLSAGSEESHLAANDMGSPSPRSARSVKFATDDLPVNSEPGQRPRKASHALANDSSSHNDPKAESAPESSPEANADPAYQSAVALRRSLRRQVEQLEETSGNLTILQPAAWVDLRDHTALPVEHSHGVQRIAVELKEKIEESGLDPKTPEYRRLWNRAVRESDWKFRARYGARAWTRHHIQAHHMAAANDSK